MPMSEELEKLAKLYEAGAKKLNALLDDIKWRQGDLADEEKTLKAMQEGHEECPSDHFEAQEIVVRTQRRVLENEIKEAGELDAELDRVRAEIEKLSSQEVEERAEEEKVERGGEAETDQTQPQSPGTTVQRDARP